jgi:hypothetical protein
MHPQKQQQMPPNVNINDPQHISNYQRQQHPPNPNKQQQQQLQPPHPSQPTKQTHHPMSQNGSHTKLPPPTHLNQNQQYPHQQQNRPVPPHQSGQQLAANMAMSNATPHNSNKPYVGQSINGQPFNSNSQIPNQPKQHIQPSPKSSFNSPNLNKANGYRPFIEFPLSLTVYRVLGI